MMRSFVVSQYSLINHSVVMRAYDRPPIPILRDNGPYGADGLRKDYQINDITPTIQSMF